jgi:hypothetical protein
MPLKHKRRRLYRKRLGSFLGVSGGKGAKKTNAKNRRNKKAHGSKEKVNKIARQAIETQPVKSYLATLISILVMLMTRS